MRGGMVAVVCAEASPAVLLCVYARRTVGSPRMCGCVWVGDTRRRARGWMPKKSLSLSLRRGLTNETQLSAKR